MPVTITLSQKEEQNLHMGLDAVYIFLDTYTDSCKPIDESIHVPLQNVDYEKQFSEHFDNLVNEYEITTQNIPTMSKEPQDSSYYKKLLTDIKSAESKAKNSVARARTHMRNGFADIETQKNDIITSANGEKSKYMALEPFDALLATVNSYTDNINKLNGNLFDKVKAQPETDRLSAPILNGKRTVPQAKEDSVIFYNTDLASLLQNKLEKLIKTPRINSIEDRVNKIIKNTGENPELILGVEGLKKVLEDSLIKLADIQVDINLKYSDKVTIYKKRIEQIDSQLNRLLKKEVIEDRINRTIKDNNAVIQKLSTLERKVQEKLDTVLVEEEKARKEAEFKAKRERFEQQLVALYQGLQKTTTTKELPAITDFVAHITNKVAAAKENSSLTEEALLARILSHESYITGLLKYLIGTEGVGLHGLNKTTLSFNDKTNDFVTRYTEIYSRVEKTRRAIKTSITNMIDSSSTPNRVFELQKALLEMEQAHNEALLNDNGYPEALDEFDNNLTKLQAEITLYENNVFKPLNQLKNEFDRLCNSGIDLLPMYSSLKPIITLIQEGIKNPQTEDDIQELRSKLNVLKLEKDKAIQEYRNSDMSQVKQEKIEELSDDEDSNAAERVIANKNTSVVEETAQEKSDRLTCAGMLLAVGKTCMFAAVGALLGGAAGLILGGGLLGLVVGVGAGAFAGAAAAAMGKCGFMGENSKSTTKQPNENTSLVYKKSGLDALDELQWNVESTSVTFK